MFHLIFEHDSWPAPVKGTSFIAPGFGESLYYRSYNTRYSGEVHDLSADNPTKEPRVFGATVNNSSIEYDFIR